MHTVERRTIGNALGYVIIRERLGRLTVEVKFRHQSCFRRKVDAEMVCYWLNQSR